MLRANLLSYTRNLGGAIYILPEASVIRSNQNKDVPQHIVILASSSHPAFLLIFFFFFLNQHPLFKLHPLSHTGSVLGAGSALRWRAVTPGPLAVII